VGSEGVAFDHVALAAQRIADATPFLVGELGGVSGFGGPSGDFRWWHWDFAEGGRIEVIEPDGPPGGFVHRYLERRGPGIHHVTFKIPSMHATLERAEALGYEVVGYNDGDPHWIEAFLHPRQAMGIVVQMVESRTRDEEPDWSAGLTPPPQPDSAPPPVSVVGVRMRSADRGRALRQWGELLGGALEATPGELRFTWPGSAMRVAVSLERGAADTSEAIEVRAPRALALPEGRHPVLGAAFLQLPG